jgi:DNA-binding CsgD family transcriptional regulator
MKGMLSREGDLSRSSLLRRADVLAVMRLLADVAAAKANVSAQHQSLLDGLAELLDVRVSGLMVADGFRPGEQHTIRQMRVGSTPEPRWFSYIRDFSARFPVTDDPYTDHLYRSAEPVALCTMQGVVPDHPASSRRFGPAMQLIRDLRLADGMVLGFRVGPRLSRLACVAMHRLGGERRFTVRQQAMLRLAGIELRRLVERDHFRLVLDDGTPDEMFQRLAPRQRQTLELLLSGRAPKEIARELGLSIWTVREYLKGLYAHFQVSGRDELMALFIAHE